MISRADIAFVDFDKTIYDLQIPDFGTFRKRLSKVVLEKFNIQDSFYPILENTQKLATGDAGIRDFVYELIDEVEENASGYFYAYAKSLLVKLSAKMPVLIISNNNSRVIRKRLEEIDLLKYVNYISGRDNSEHFKPSGEVLNFSCKQVGISPKLLSHFVYIGDSWRDYKCAADFGSLNNLNYTFINAGSLAGNEHLYDIK